MKSSLGMPNHESFSGTEAGSGSEGKGRGWLEGWMTMMIAMAAAEVSVRTNK